MNLKNNAISAMYSTHFAKTVIAINKLIKTYPYPVIWSKTTSEYVEFHPYSKKITEVGWDVIESGE